MKKSAILFAALVAIYLVLPSNAFAQQASYEGVSVCTMCHKTEKQGQQLKLWQESKHANAYKTLQTPKADEIAKAKTGKKAVESPECLKCHATGYNVDKALIGPKFKVEDGVQCETCHGAGSLYKSMAVMKNQAESIKKGMTDLKDAESQCKKCHNPESPTYKEFKFAEAAAKIKHSVPKS